MIRQLLALGLVMLLTSVASAARYEMQELANQSGYRTAIYETVGTDDFLVARATGYMRLAFTRGNTFAATVYACETKTYVASECASLTTLSATTNSVTLETGRPWIVIDVTTAETAGSVSYITIRGHYTSAGAATGGGGALANFTQPSPSLGTDAGGLVYDITDPVTTQYGYDSKWGNSAGSFNETNNILGPYYNKASVGGPGCVNQFEHAWDRSWETNYNASATLNEPWVEENWDIYPPQNTATLSGASGTPPSAGDALTFSGGGTGKVVSLVGSTLVWRHNLGVTSDAETVSSGGWSANIDSITSDCVTASWRAYLSVYQVLNNTVEYTWDTTSGGDQRDNFKVSNGGIAIGANTSPNGVAGPRLLVEGTQPSSAQAQIKFEAEASGSYASPRALDVFLDSSAASSTVSGSARAIYIDTAVAASGSNFAGGIQGIHIANFHDGGDGTTQGTSSDAIYIAAQTPNSGSQNSQHGNINMAGGNWNTGHLRFGAGQGNHLWFNATDDVFHISTVADNTFRPLSEDDGAQLMTARPRTADPCGSKPEAYTFYNDTSDYFCFCNGSGADVQMHSPATACF